MRTAEPAGPIVLVTETSASAHAGGRVRPGYLTGTTQPRGTTTVDIYCRTCGTPWDTYEVQTCLAEELETTPAQALQLFQRKGCEAFPGAKCAEDAEPSLRGEATAVLLDLMPDDADGVAAMLEDAEYMGVFR